MLVKQAATCYYTWIRFNAQLLTQQYEGGWCTYVSRKISEDEITIATRGQGHDLVVPQKSENAHLVNRHVLQIEFIMCLIYEVMYTMCAFER